MVDVVRDRHVKHSKHGPIVLQQGQGNPPDGNPSLEIGDAVQGVVNPQIAFLAVHVITLETHVPKHVVLREVATELSTKEIDQVQFRFGHQIGIELHVGIALAVVGKGLLPGLPHGFHGKLSQLADFRIL